MTSVQSAKAGESARAVDARATRETTSTNADLIGRHTVVRPSPDRQLAIDAFAAVRSGHPMVALLEFDVTDAEAAIAALRSEGVRVSMFAFVVRAIAVALSEHPDLNTVRHGKRLVRFADVDVNVPIEVHTAVGDVPRQLVIRRAQHKSAPEIYAELEGSRARHERSGETSDEDRWAQRSMSAIRHLPSFLRIGLIRWIMRSAFRIKAHAGTTLVTSVSKFASIPGASFTFTTGPRAAVFVVGGVVPKPWVHEGSVVARSVLSLSVIVDHDLVDGAPAARFARSLERVLRWPSSDDRSNTPLSHPATAAADPPICSARAPSALPR